LGPRSQSAGRSEGRRVLQPPPGCLPLARAAESLVPPWTVCHRLALGITSSSPEGREDGAGNDSAPRRTEREMVEHTCATRARAFCNWLNEAARVGTDEYAQLRGEGHRYSFGGFGAKKRRRLSSIVSKLDSGSFS